MKEVYRSFKAWDEAMRLSQMVHGLIESLPSDEQSALAMSLNAAVVNIPTTVALNLMQNQEPDVRDMVALRTQLELIDRIYPALDTAETTEAADVLFARLLDPSRFREPVPQPTPPPDPDQPQAEDEPEAVQTEVQVADEVEEPPEPTHIDVQS